MKVSFSDVPFIHGKYTLALKVTLPESWHLCSIQYTHVKGLLFTRIGKTQCFPSCVGICVDEFRRQS